MNLGEFNHIVTIILLVMGLVLLCGVIWVGCRHFVDSIDSDSTSDGLKSSSKQMSDAIRSRGTVVAIPIDIGIPIDQKSDEKTKNKKSMTLL